MFGSVEWHFLIIGAIVGSLVTTICCNKTCYGENFSGSEPYDDLPLPECFIPEFILYTDANTTGVNISKTYIPTEFSILKKTVFIIHGYGASADQQWVTDMKKALLNRDYYNVITVDWSDHADFFLFQPYGQAATNTRVCAKGVADLLKRLKLKGLSQSLSHCIGHSLGAHICGQAGQREKFGRISGLDPAGLQYIYPVIKPNGTRLSSDDADFVDVIHTDAGSGGFGTFYPMGDVDFYPNGGRSQPGCMWLFGCSHSRALDLYTKSISSPCFKSSYKCTDYKHATLQHVERKSWFLTVKKGSCIPCTKRTSFCQVMGYDAIFYSGRGCYYVGTYSESPFCKN